MLEGHTIRIAGHTTVAQALLSQGTCTAPRSLFIAVPTSDAGDPIIVAEYEHERKFYHNSHYFYPGPDGNAVAEAYEAFGRALDLDARLRIARGVPLTGFPQDEAAGWQRPQAALGA
jgi:hypothetical protein